MNTEFSTIYIERPDGAAASSHILIVYTGGTFGMRVDASGSYLEPSQFGEIIKKLPELNNINIDITILSLGELQDSSNFTTESWVLVGDIINKFYEEFDGFVILHGTDTMAYSASALSFMFEGLSKPIIFTGAQLPFGALRTDARENLITSLEIASAKQDGLPMVPEVTIYFGEVLLRGNRATKIESELFDAFESQNYPELAVAGTDIQYQEAFIRKNYHAELVYSNLFDSSVALIPLFPGMKKEYLEFTFDQSSIDLFILESFGAGNIPIFPWFINVLEKAIDKGKIILNVSQCIGGVVNHSRYENSRVLKDLGVLSGIDMSREAAITKTMFLLGKHKKNRAKLKQELVKDLRGEMRDQA